MVGYIIEAGHVRDGRQPQQQAVPPAGPPGPLPVADQVRDREHGLLTVAEDHHVEEVRHRFGVERGVAAGDHQGMVRGPFGRGKRDARQVEHGQEVRVRHLGGEAQPEHVEGADRPVRVQGELGQAVLAHQRLEVGPHGVGAFGEDAVALVQHLVEDLDALVGQAHLVGVRVAQRPADVGAVPVLDDRAHLAADVLDRLAHARQQRLKRRVHRFDRHQNRVAERTGLAAASPLRARRDLRRAGAVSLPGLGRAGPQERDHDHVHAEVRPGYSKMMRRRWTDWSRPIAIMSAKMADPP